jgi:hypothetical protein
MEEKIIGINIDRIMKRLGPPSIVFNNNNGEIILALGYQIIDIVIPLNKTDKRMYNMCYGIR